MASSKYCVFITAPEVDMKTLNKAFYMLQDFEFGGDDVPVSQWVLFPFKTITPEKMKDTKFAFTVPPISDEALEAAQTEFTDYTFDDINNFMRSNQDALDSAGFDNRTWIVMDTEALRTETAVVFEQIYNYDEQNNKGEYSDKYHGVRLPYKEVWSVVVNLDIANMGFEDFIDENAGIQEDGTWKTVLPFKPSNEAISQMAKEADSRREMGLKELRKLGHI